MFEIKIENTFLEKTFIDLFNQKKIPLISFSSKKNHNNLITIEISNDNYIVFSFNNLLVLLLIKGSFFIFREEGGFSEKIYLFDFILGNLKKIMKFIDQRNMKKPIKEVK